MKLSFLPSLTTFLAGILPFTTSPLAKGETNHPWPTSVEKRVQAVLSQKGTKI